MPLPIIDGLRRTFRFPVIGRLWKFLVFLAVYAVAVSTFEAHAGLFGVAAPTPHVAEVVLTSLIFGGLLNFRTNTAYDRWWEARKLWGTLVNISRNIALKTIHVVRPPAADVAEVQWLIGEFARTMRARLGGVETRPGHVPMEVAGEMYALLSRWGDAGRVNTWQALIFDAEVRQMMDVIGACERIRSTPLVASYRGLLRKGIFVYLLGVPWLIVGDMGQFTVLVTVLVGYVLIALELVADDIEEPFGWGPDDLNLDDVVKVIERSAGAYPHPEGRWAVPGGVIQSSEQPPAGDGRSELVLKSAQR